MTATLNKGRLFTFSRVPDGKLALTDDELIHAHQRCVEDFGGPGAVATVDANLRAACQRRFAAVREALTQQGLEGGRLADRVRLDPVSAALVYFSLCETSGSPDVGVRP